MASKLNLENLSVEEKEKLKEYVDSIKEIKKEIVKLVKKGKAPQIQEDEDNMDSNGGGDKTGLYLNI
jgi:hypothetical protein